MIQKLLDYTKKHQELYLPFLWTKWGVPPEEFTKALCKIWGGFPNPRMINNLLVLNVKKEPNYYEFCNKYNRGKYLHKKHYWDYCELNQKVNQHVSVFSHDEKWVETYKETGSVSCKDTIVGTDYIYLELDRETLKEAIKDAIKYYNKSPYKEYITMWYSGNTSIHIVIDSSLFGRPMGKQEILCGRNRLIYNLAHKLVGDLRYNNGCGDPWSMSGTEVKLVWKKTFREIPNKNKHELKQELENIDPNLFNVNSLIRQPYSYHEKGNQKLLYTKGKKIFDINRKFSYIDYTNKPYLIHWVYECWEEKKQKREYTIDVDKDEIISLFSKAFKYFDPSQANPQGYVNGLYNPLYDDTNNSVSVSIKTGYVHDFGSPSHCMNFNKFKEKCKERGIIS